MWQSENCLDTITAVDHTASHNINTTLKRYTRQDTLHTHIHSCKRSANSKDYIKYVEFKIIRTDKWISMNYLHFTYSISV